MSSKIKDMFKRSTQSSKHKDSMEQESGYAGGVSLHDPVPYINVLDTDLFTNDYEYWFAKVTFQYSLAMVIEKEHQGHACINPKDVLAAMEASYWHDANHTICDDRNIRYPRVETFDRINAARLTKSEEALETYMCRLSDDIKRYCRGLREGAIAELAAQPQNDLNVTYRTESLDSTTSNDSSLENTPVTSDSDEDTSSSSQDEAEHGQITPRSQGPLVSETLEAELPIHKYTSMLWEFAAKFGKEPKIIEAGFPGAWICEVSFDGCCRQATAQNKKKARHIAAQMLCEALHIPREMAKI